jgi:uncharacterized protein (DUF1015 family)
MTEPVRSQRTGRPLQLVPFRALRYSPDVVPDLAAVTCPPYDVIGDGGIATWEAADPYNVVRLILPRGSPRGDRYEHAARDLNDWLALGVLRVDSEPALYVYEHSGNAGTAVGLVGAISLHDPADNVVLAHEDVLPGPVADRTELMAATRAQLEPILLTYGGGGPASAAVDAALLTEPIIATKTADGAQHRIWRLISPITIAEIEADLAGRQALIADGHHRYAAYRALRERAGQPTDQVAVRYGLAMLVDADSHPLRLGSIHRSIAGLPLSEATTAAARGFRTVALLPTELDPVGVLSEAGHAGPALVLSDGRHSALLRHPIRDRVEACLPAGRSRTWQNLDATIAYEFLLPRLFGVDDADRRVTYHHEARAALDRARRLGGVALLLKPASHDDVLAVAAAGERMPRKSTSFGPKPRTGLLMRLLTEFAVPGPAPAAAHH